MQEIINVNLNDNHEPIVSARELYKELNVKTRFSLWVEQNFKILEEGYDFTSVVGTTVVNNGAVREVQDYALSLDAAKNLAMASKTDKGKQVRQYFIQVEKDFNSPEKIMARALLMADKKITHLTMENTQLQLELQEAQKQARYLDLIIESKGALRVTQIAADYGMSANKFNKTLLELGVQHKINGQWILYKKYMGKGYTDSHTFDYQDKNGHTRANVTTTWTQKGRLFLYELLKDNGILPLIEQDDVA
ncbi:phage antirepressor KilAC domain-containing protein [Streptococcus suis]